MHLTSPFWRWKSYFDIYINSNHLIKITDRLDNIGLTFFDREGSLTHIDDVKVDSSNISFGNHHINIANQTVLPFDKGNIFKVLH